MATVHPRKITAQALLLASVALVVCTPSVHAQLTFLSTFGSSGAAAGQFNGPEGITLGSNGNLYVADTENNRVQVFNANGAYLSSFSDNTPRPFGVAIGPNGNIYVPNANDTVAIFNSSGVYQSYFGQYGTGNGQFIAPYAIAVDSGGTVYVPDADNNRVEMFNSTGTFLNHFVTGLSQPQGIAISTGGTVYVSNTANEQVNIYNKSGSLLNSFGSQGSGNGQFAYPMGIALGSSGLIYVADWYNGRIEVFNSSGAFQSAASGGANASLSRPTGIALSSSGILYVADSNNGRIMRFFDPDSWASGTDAFTDPSLGPTSVAVGSGQMLGSSLILDNTRGLQVGGALSVNHGGSFTLSGGSILSKDFVVDGTSGGANFTMTSGKFTDSTVEVTNGGIADFAGTTLNVNLGGALSVTGAGSQFKIDQGAIVSTPSLTNTGAVVIGSNADFIVYGNTTNNGSIIVNNGLLDIRGSLTNAAGAVLQGSGTINVHTLLTNNGTIQFSNQTTLNGSLQNNANASIEIPGLVPTVFSYTVTNNGSISLDPGASATFLAALSGNGTILNNGAISIQANSSVARVSGFGALTLGSGSSSARLQLTTSGGTTTLSSLLLNNASSLDLTNNPLIVEAVSNHAGVLSTLRAKVLAGQSASAGIFSSGLAPKTTIALLDNAVSGFSTFGGVAVDANSILIAPELPGDANADGQVNLTDLSRVLNNFGKSSSAWTDGNFDNASTIDLTDLSDVLNNFGATNPGAGATLAANGTASAAAAAPEPASLALLLPTLLLLRPRSRGANPLQSAS
ncbi:MAG TPA: hypothetical protein VM008_12820 [Phycisphaerae bacterium]|nr:hypothetical protein [Phycisphaerae bacterium]